MSGSSDNSNNSDNPDNSDNSDNSDSSTDSSSDRSDRAGDDFEARPEIGISSLPSHPILSCPNPLICLFGMEPTSCKLFIDFSGSSGVKQNQNN